LGLIDDETLAFCIYKNINDVAYYVWFLGIIKWM
jgi:hypothetical protein